MRKKKIYDNHYKKYIAKGELMFSNFENNKKLFSLLKAKKGMKILEIGCGTGYFLEHLRKKGFHRLAGCELTGPALDYCRAKRKGIDFSGISGKKLPYKDGSFDLALSFDVIEHIPDVGIHLGEVCRILKKGGTYAFATPKKWIDAPLNFYRKDYFDIHCSLQTKRSLKKLALKNGFNRVNFFDIDYELSPATKRMIPRKISWLMPIGDKLMRRIIKPAIFGAAYKK